MERTDDTPRAPRLPPRWFVRFAWAMHRAIHRATAGRLGLRAATDTHSGLLRLRTTGRKSGSERQAILGYIEDGPNLVLVAMNGWADPDPAWWLNLQARPDAVVDLTTGPRAVSARVATGTERDRLWQRLAGPFGTLDRYAALRSRETQVVILEPRASAP